MARKITFKQKRKSGQMWDHKKRKKLRCLFLMRLWFGSTCAFGAMHGGMEQDGAMWVMFEGLGALIGQISQIFGCVGQVLLLFGWTGFWLWCVIFQSASAHSREKGGDGLESALDLFGCIPDDDGYDGFRLSDPVFDACGFVVSGQVEDVAIGSQHHAA
jgi:hypothetical protein